MITLNDIHSALRRIRESIYLSPCARSETFSQSTGNDVYLKLDNLQRTGSFKERGALNKLLSLSAEERARGVIAASAGNHAQGVAHHAGKLGIRAQICMPLTTPLIKVSATRGYGADVVLHGANYDEAYEEAVRRSQAESLTFVHAFDDDAVIAGQGTIGLELIEQHPDLQAVVVPIGGGGLIGGIACAVKETNPKIQVFGVQPSRLPSMKVALAEGKPVTLNAASTIADGIAVRRAGDRTLPLVQKYVDDIVTVEEEEIANAILLLLEREKTLAEGAGAAVYRKESGGAGVRWQHRRDPAVEDHRTRLSQRRTAGSFARSSWRLPRRAAPSDVDPRATSRQHRRDRLRPRLPWCESRRDRHRNHHGNARSGSHRGNYLRIGRGGICPGTGAVGGVGRTLSSDAVDSGVGVDLDPECRSAGVKPTCVKPTCKVKINIAE